MTMRKTFFQQLGLATILLLGFGVVIGLVIGWSISILEAVMVKPTIYQDIIVMHDGTPIVQKISFNQFGYGDNPYTYFTLDGKKITVKRDERFLESANLTGSRDLMKQTGFPVYQNRIAAFSDQRESPTFWYFVHDGYPDGKGYFIGFDTKSNQCVGYIGLRGNCSNLPSKEEWFPMDGCKIQAGGAFTNYDSRYPRDWDYGEEQEIPYWKVVMISGDQLLEVNLRTGSIRTIIKMPDLMSVRILTSANKDEPPDRNRWRQHIVMRTSERIIVVDSAGKQIDSYAIPKDIQPATLNFYEIENEKAIISCRRYYPDFKYWEQLTWIDPNGIILDRKQVELLERGSHPISKNDSWQAALVEPAPITMFFMALAAGPASYFGALEDANYADALAYSLNNVWQPFIVVCILATVLAWICYRRQRRMVVPWTWFWVGFVFLFGVPGFLAYLFHRRWPVLEKCHVCDQTVPQDREACAACGSEFPTPAPKGIEVFA
jgi:hypothetical protein